MAAKPTKLVKVKSTAAKDMDKRVESSKSNKDVETVKQGLTGFRGKLLDKGFKNV